MKARDLKEKFINFFVAQKHIEIPSASLTPENDPTTLFISAGMHPLVPYLLGQPHPLGKRLTDVQKCVRTGDIDEVGDGYHHTFFEMLGNWSLGDYFKTEAISWSYQFLTKELNIDPKNLHFTCFEGDQDAPKDTESHDLWLKQGIPEERIHYLPKKDNWWGPAGSVGPCGPDTEMFIDTNPNIGEIDFQTGCKQGRIIEIWNDVFMQYYKDENGKFSEMKQKNVDTGMGVERTTAILSGFSDNYLSDIWQPIIKAIEVFTPKKYEDNPKIFRIIADHLKAAVFIIADGVEPSNKEAGYVLRRLIRRAVRQGKLLGIENNFTVPIATAILKNQGNYAGVYLELNQNRDRIFSVLENEENKFRKTLNNGLREINKLIENKKIKSIKNQDNSLLNISGKEAFTLYESFGFPIEMVEEELQKNNLTLNKEEFEEAKLAHQKQSQTLSAGKFKSGLANNSEIITKYHTATHLLHSALRKILGDNVQQSGSNITSERLRFDFSHSEKLTDDQLKEVQDLVNQQIKLDLPVVIETMPFVEAQKQNALAFFGNKYPETVTVYTIGSAENYFSKEVCTGPHVTRLSELGNFEIIKEESAGSGKRRIYAILK
ncbi:MAG: alanine--tRNA ligase [Candidatus Shapirobacteria bacterium]|nr:alanine--tRNA ligase [Candidatus Shapirobacteria bacterium]MDD3002364.1 alanine--tRNA ligase [Candidatus Shapirobacteria bacterium]MDD4383328.1 alanine--tRNA ligase [Candidatus Shapirobacteria bacterium]